MKVYEKLGMSTEDAPKWAKECSTRKCLNCPAYKNAQLAAKRIGTTNLEVVDRDGNSNGF